MLQMIRRGPGTPHGLRLDTYDSVSGEHTIGKQDWVTVAGRHHIIPEGVDVDYVHWQTGGRLCYR